MQVVIEILEYIKDKKVLYVGCLGDYKRYSRTNYEDWNFLVYQKYCKSILGTDINIEGLNLINDKFNVVYDDIENSNINDVFDIIIFLDVIEHLYNIGKAFKNFKKLLKEEGKLLILTPNPYYVPNIVKALCGNIGRISNEHTSWLVPKHLENLTLKHSFKIKKIYYINLVDKRNIYLKIKSKLYNFISFFNKKLSSHFLFIITNN